MCFFPKVPFGMYDPDTALHGGEAGAHDRVAEKEDDDVLRFESEARKHARQ